MVANLFPQGSRTVELCSAYALILLSVCTLFFGIEMPELHHVGPKLEWVILLAIFGSLQVYSLYNYPKVEVLRLLTSWCAGCFWLYIGIKSSTLHMSAEDIASIMLGLGNLYGFVISFNLMKVTWKR